MMNAGRFLRGPLLLFFLPGLLALACISEPGDRVNDVDDRGCPVLDVLSEGHLDRHCYRVTQELHLERGTVVIEAGTTLYFERETGLHIGQDAGLRIRGTAVDPVVMTAADQRLAERGYWDGLTYASSRSTDNHVEHLILEYAGHGSFMEYDRFNGGLDLRGNSRVTIENSVFRHNANSGLAGSHDGAEIDLSGSHFEDNGTAIAMYPNVALGISSDNTFADNDYDEVFLWSAGNRERDGCCDHFTRSGTLSALPVPYHMDDTRWGAGTDFFTVQTGADLVIEPGATLVFEQDKGLRAVSNASLKIGEVGQDPVVFVGLQDDLVGYWRGISYGDGSLSTDNQVHNAIIDGASIGVEVSGHARVDIHTVEITNANLPVSVTSEDGILTGCEDLNFHGNDGDSDIHDEADACL